MLNKEQETHFSQKPFSCGTSVKQSQVLVPVNIVLWTVSLFGQQRLKTHVGNAADSLSHQISCACKTLQAITGNQGSPLNPPHVWMGDHVKLLKRALIQDFRSRAKFGTLSWQGRDPSWSSITVQRRRQQQRSASATQDRDMTNTLQLVSIKRLAGTQNVRYEQWLMCKILCSWLKYD